MHGKRPSVSPGAAAEPSEEKGAGAEAAVVAGAKGGAELVPAGSAANADMSAGRKSGAEIDMKMLGDRVHGCTPESLKDLDGLLAKFSKDAKSALKPKKGRD